MVSEIIGMRLALAKIFYVNRPFLFYIRHHPSKILVYLGRYTVGTYQRRRFVNKELLDRSHPTGTTQRNSKSIEIGPTSNITRLYRVGTKY